VRGVFFITARRKEIAKAQWERKIRKDKPLWFKNTNVKCLPNIGQPCPTFAGSLPRHFPAKEEGLFANPRESLQLLQPAICFWSTPNETNKNLKESLKYTWINQRG